MQKRNSIRWRSADEKELAKAVRKFNAKRTRIIKAMPEMEEYLPKKASTKEIRQKVQTRRELKNELKSLERFMRKGAEKPILTQEGIKTTQYEKKEVGIKVRALNIRRAAERKKANVSTEKGTMGAIRNAGLNPKKYDINKIKKSDWEKFVAGVEKMLKDSYSYEKYETYKKNFITALENAFGMAGDKLIELAKQIPAETLVQMYYDDPILQIDFIYDPIEMQAKVEAMEEHLQDYINEKT